MLLGAENVRSGFAYSPCDVRSLVHRCFTLRDAIGSSHPIDKRGETVRVIYEPADLDRAIIDRGIWNWAIPGGSGLFGALILVASLRGLVGAYRRRGAEMSPRGG
jgi:hypothetical protein